jgi:histone H3/H4
LSQQYSQHSRRAVPCRAAHILGPEHWKTQSLPLARIKKIMKSEEFTLQELERERLQQQHPGEEVEIDKQKTKFMISQEAPMLMTKACELLVKELTVRAWQHTERNRRRTLQRADLHAAVGESEVFDFLIDIVPRVASLGPPARQPAVDTADRMPQQLSVPTAAAMQQAVSSNDEGSLVNAGDAAQMMQHDPNQYAAFFYPPLPAPGDGTDGALLQQAPHGPPHWTD